MSFRIAAVVFLLGLSVVGCSRETPQLQEMLDEDLNCPEGSKARFDRWSGIDNPGWAHKCNMNHGKYHVWRDGILIIEGQFSYGKKEGNWLYRNDDGEIFKTITYKNGMKQN